MILANPLCCQGHPSLGHWMHFHQWKRREFITLLGSVAAWPLAAGAQPRARMRRIGVLSAPLADDPQSQARNAAFLQGLGELGWRVGRNLEINYRWGGIDAKRHTYAAELLALAPEAILAVGASVVGPLLAATRTVPVVFTQVTDPVGSGIVASLARPGGNATGFTLFEFGISAKWIALLKEIAPRVTRALVLLDSASATGFGQLGAIQSAAHSLGVEISPINIRDRAEIEPAVAAVVRGLNDGLIVLPGPQTVIYRELIITVAARHRLPAVYPYPYYVSNGGLICYGPNELEQYGQAAGYVDRILKGEKPADLPVQAPTKYELVINLKTAKALGLEVPAAVLVRADDVIDETARLHIASRRRGNRMAPLLQATRTVPIVFVLVADPVGAGFVDTLARPSGNATGFLQFEYDLSGKWLELAQADRAGRDASGGPSGSRHNRRDRPIRRNLQPGLDSPEQPEAHLAVIARERDHETHPPVA